MTGSRAATSSARGQRITSFPPNEILVPKVPEDLIHHLLAPPDGGHLEEDGEDHATEHIIKEADPHTGMISSGLLQNRIIVRKFVKAPEVLVRTETGKDKVPEIGFSFFCERRQGIRPDRDPVFLCMHDKPDRDISDPDTGPESAILEDLLWGGPWPAGRFCDGQREVERFGNGEGKRQCVREVHCCVVVAGIGNKGEE